MDNFTLHLGNYFLYVLHTALILFNLFGWLFPRWRKLNLISLFATFASWVILGIWKGWGYCFLTDWHYTILFRLGETHLPPSYINFLLYKLTGYTLSARLIDFITVSFALIALCCSIWMNFKKRKS